MSKLDELHEGSEVVIAIKYLAFGYGGQHAIVEAITSGNGLPDDNPYRSGMVTVRVPGRDGVVSFPPEELVLCRPGVWPEPKLTAKAAKCSGGGVMDEIPRWLVLQSEIDYLYFELNQAVARQKPVTGLARLIDKATGYDGIPQEIRDIVEQIKLRQAEYEEVVPHAN